MKTTILNREFKHPADGWYQIEPKGVHPNQEAGVTQIIDDEATRTIVNRFNTDAAANKLRHGSEMLIDHEHFSDQADQETRAYGWLQELQNRDDGIYGRIRWTTTGQAAVDGGDYRFFSTEYLQDEMKVLNGGKMKRMRPLRLDGLSLTNGNNNRGQKPITNREQEFRRANPADNNPQPKKQTMKTIATRLGLSAEASEESVLEAVNKIFNRAEKAEGELTPIKNRVLELETSNGVLLDEQIAADLATHKVTEEKVKNRLTPVLKAMKNREERITFLTEVCNKPAEGKTIEQRKLHNRETKPPGGNGSAPHELNGYHRQNHKPRHGNSRKLSRNEL